MATPIWLYSDAQAVSTSPGAITNSQTTLTLGSTATFPVPGPGQQYYIRIDTTPISTVYEYVLVTANNTGTNTLTVTRGQAGTSGTAFSANATVSAVLLAEQLTGTMLRIDQTTNQTMTGPLTTGGALSVPPAAGGALPPTGYGTVPVKLAEVVVTVATANISINSIPQGYQHLQLSVTAQGSSGSDQVMWIQFNGDTSTNYSSQYLLVNGASVTGALSTTSGQIATLATAAGNYVAWVWRYSSAAAADQYKRIRSWGTRGTNGAIEDFNVIWKPAASAAITQITLASASGNFVVGSAVQVYGIP